MCTQVSTHADARVCDPSLRTRKVEVRDARVHLERLCQGAGSLFPNAVHCECARMSVHTPRWEERRVGYVRRRLRFVMPVFTLSASARARAPSSPMLFAANVHAGQYTRRCESMRSVATYTQG